jgi:hypothetical protein
MDENSISLVLGQGEVDWTVHDPCSSKKMRKHAFRILNCGGKLLSCLRGLLTKRVKST